MPPDIRHKTGRKATTCVAADTHDLSKSPHIRCFEEFSHGDLCPNARSALENGMAQNILLVSMAIVLGGFLSGQFVQADSLKKIDLDVLIFSGTQWTEAIAQKRILEINKVYAQCDVSIGNVAIQIIVPSTGEVNLYRNLDDRSPGGLRAVATALGSTPRLTIVLIRQFQEGIAGTAGVPAMYESAFPEMVNRAWVTEEIFEPTYIRERNPAYVTEAHELAHILLNASHLPKGAFGLMSGEFDHVTGDLSATECAKIRASHFAH